MQRLNVQHSALRSCALAFVVAMLFLSAAVVPVLRRRPEVAVVQQPTTGSGYGDDLPIWTYSHWPPFRLPERSKAADCFGFKDAVRSVEYLAKVIQRWQLSPKYDCRHNFRIFDALYSVRQTRGKLNITSRVLANKIRKWLGSNDEYFANVYHQEIIAVSNKYTYEATLFNPLRSKRPIPSTGALRERDYVDNISNASQNDCDFCSYKENTAVDPFGRLESTYAYTAANAFKYDAWHSMIVPRSHHPLTWTKVEFFDMFDLANQWIQRVSQEDESLLYPLMLWDLLPHSGASQVHPHTHVSISANAYYGIPEGWRAAADRFYEDSGDNYFSNLVAVHDALGLAVFHNQAVAFAHLTPKKENEVIIIGNKVDNDFVQLLYSTLRAFIDDMEHACFSMSLVYPPLKPGTPGMVPAFARVVTRGNAYDIRSDVSSMELFGPNNVNQDPFKLITSIRKSVSLRTAAA